MIEILDFLNFKLPNIIESSDDLTNKFGPTGPNNLFEIKKIDNTFFLRVKGEQWMMYETDNHFQVSQLFSHYYLAYGDVIVSGLGLGLRESWLLNSPKIKSLTILERNQDIIDYHKKNNPIFFDKSNIIKCDAYHYKGKCDTLLLDHFELEPIDVIVNDIVKICENIECERLWFWPLETLIISNAHQMYHDVMIKKFRRGEIKINIELTLRNIKLAYDIIKKDFKLNKLPDLKLEELQLIVSIYTHFFKKL